MKLSVIGTGYVGLVSGVCFAELGNQVICVDKDSEKIKMLNNLEMPIYEPGLKELVQNNVQESRISFTSDIKEAVASSDVIFIAVGTPPLPNGQADLRFIEAVAASIGKYMNDYKLIVNKSTVPVGTGDFVREIVMKHQAEPVDFDIVSVPEFLREGNAIQDSMNPDRVIIGASSNKAAEIMKKLHEPFNAPVLITDVKSAEMIKYASNAFLATKISFINEIANICEKVGANVKEVAKGMGYDKRIGDKFLNAGIGYGGSCFPKDTTALVEIAASVDYDFKILKSVVDVNKKQRFKVIDSLKQIYDNLDGKKVAVLGLAFKPNTDDLREAPSINIIEELIAKNVHVKAYDPIAMNNATKIIRNTITYSSSVLEAVEGVDAIILVTEWHELIEADWFTIGNLVNKKIIIDGRNVIDSDLVESLGFIYKGIGV
ncbi:UDP-glucose/GDP-mannose dehydrogenase family protein [Metallumcola ferriviriculae]|uniref:UDP-glucose 6-dehydrogenase n=1 Tax=Metallumcola ferriviriculae TaxID=3039180 RepID=A0AAU0UIN1_9FIRM|nr:UDP-glucose/GDP-mannose dehydrogenase family protein [Desulfitibacteraceae bacterium MK1]